MSTREKENKYREALRYLENASEILKQKANKKDNDYEDAKYVRMACGTAYSGTLLAIDTFLEIKGKSLKKRSRLSVEDYRKQLTVLDKKLLKTFNTAYQVLHLFGYYDGGTNSNVIKEGLESAKEIINKIKPAGLHLN